MFLQGESRRAVSGAKDAPSVPAGGPNGLRPAARDGGLLVTGMLAAGRAITRSRLYPAAGAARRGSAPLMSPLITQAVAVDPDGGVRELDLGAGAVQMDALCRAIGSTLDMLTPQLLKWVDDEGVVNGSAVNTVATELVSETPQLRNQPASAAPLVLTGAANPEGGRDVAGTGMGAGPPARPQSGEGFELIPPESEQNVCHPAGGFPVSGLGLEFGFSGPKCSRVSHALSVRKCVPGSENQTVGPLRASGYPRRPGPQPGRDRNPVGTATRARAGTRTTRSGVYRGCWLSRFRGLHSRVRRRPHRA